jgi:MFS family permease
MPPQWYFSRNGQTFGPFSLEQLQDLAREGRLLPGDLAAHEGATQWVPASTLAGVFAPPAAPPPPPQPVPAAPLAPVFVQPAPRRTVPVASVSPRPAPAARPAARPPSTPEVVPTPAARTVPGGGFVRALLALPKPILFGLCGAAGGLLGALLLGELLWLLLSPREVEAPPPRVQMAGPKAPVPVYAGGKNRFRVKIGREGFTEGKVILDAPDPSWGIRVTPVTLGPGQDEGSVEIHADRATPPKEHQVRIRGRSLDGKVPEGKEVEAGSLALKVAVNPRPASIGLAAAPSVKLYQGRQIRLTLRAARENYDGKIPVAFAGVPKGLTVKDAKDPAAKELAFPAGKDATSLEVDLVASDDLAPQTYNLTLSARGAAGGPQLKEVSAQVQLEILKTPQADILFVLDLTGSMQFAINGVKDGILKCVSELDKRVINARVGLVGFRDIEADKERPFVLKFDGETFTRNFESFKDQVNGLKAKDGGDIPESSLQAMALAAEQRFRPDAAKVIVLITDAPPKIHMMEPVSTVEQAVDVVAKSPINQVHLIVRRGDQPTYKRFQDERKRPGVFFPIEDVTRGDAFAEILPQLGAAISKITAPEAPEAPKTTAEPPALPEASSTQELPPVESVGTLQAVQSASRYATSDFFRLVLAIAIWTMAVAACISFLILAGQFFYTKQTWPPGGEVGRAVGGGVLAGLVGGAVGQLVGGSLTGSTVGEALSRILGWGLLGGLMGTGMAFVIPNLRWDRGLLGGLVGGVCGALGFLLVNALLGQLLGRWIGAAILGFCIGLMVALAEQLFRRWWLEIAFGAREVRTVTLGTAAVSVGGDEQAASVYVPGSPAVALRYWLHGESVLCEDRQTGQTVEVQPGDRRALGRVTVTVCSPASAKQVGLALTLSDGRSLLLGVGMPLTAEDLPGLQAQGADGVVALVSARPSAPRSLLLRNRSRQTWTVMGADGKPKTIEPGLGAELQPGLQLRFGQLSGVLAPADQARR